MSVGWDRVLRRRIGIAAVGEDGSLWSLEWRGSGEEGGGLAGAGGVVVIVVAL